MSASGVSFRPDISSPYFVVEEYVNELVRKVNEYIITNFVLRDIIYQEMQAFDSERLIKWIHDPHKKWQDLPESEDYKFELPQSIDNLFQRFKRTIRNELREIVDQEACKQFIIQKTRENSAKIYPTSDDWYENVGLTESPSEDLKTAIISLLSVKSVQSLDNTLLKMKFTEFWRAMDEGGASTSPLIMQKLKEIFEINNVSAARIASSFAQANPFKLKLVELLLNNQHDLYKLDVCCKNRFVCFFDGIALKSFKVEHVTKRQDCPPNVSHFILEGAEGEQVEFSVLIDSKRIIDGRWKQKIQKKLSEAINHLRKSRSEILLEVKRDYQLPEVNLNLSGHYQISFKNTKKFKDIFFSRELEGKEIVICFRKDQDESDFYCFSTIINEKTTSYNISLESFFSCYTAKIMDETVFKFSELEQNRIYLTNFEPPTNKKVARELKEHTEAELHAVSCLMNHHLDAIYRFLIEKREEQDFLSEENELYRLMYDNLVDKDAELKAQLITLCRLRKIAHRSKEEASILLNLIHRANIGQLCPGVEFSENPQLIRMLGISLEKSKELSGKRGVILIGSTGSGKSTTACYLIGIKMAKCMTRYGEMNMKIEDEINAQDAPRLGFSLGVSETIFAEKFAFRSIEEIEGEGRFKRSRSVNFPVHISRDTFSVVDFPGFEDTRGTDFEIVTNFSVDHSIKAMEAIDAIGLVISYDAITVKKGSLFIDALRDLSFRFPGCMDDPDLAERIFILITKQPDGVESDHLRNRAHKLLEEIKEQEFKQEAPDLLTIKLLSFFAKQCDTERVIPVFPFMPLERIGILNAILKNSQPSNIPPEKTLKHCYRTTFDSCIRAIKFSDILNEAIKVWSAYALPEFLTISQENIKEASDELSRVQQEIKDKEEDIEKIDQENEKLTKEIEEKERVLTNLKQLRENEEAQLPEGLFDQIKLNQQKQTEIIIEKLKSDKKRRDEANKTIDSFEKKLKEIEEKLENIADEINLRQQEKEEKTTGIQSRSLYQLERKKEEEPIKVRRWKSGIDFQGKWRRAIDRGTDVLSDSENKSNYDWIKYSLKDKFNTLRIANIDKSFQLIPPGQGIDALNDLIQGKKILILGNDGFEIHIESCKVRFDHIRHHRDGKRVTYGYQEMFDGQPPYPKLKITHVIPNSALYASEVKVLRNKIASLKGQQTACLEAQGRNQYSLEQATKEYKIAERAYNKTQSEKEKLESRVRRTTVKAYIISYENGLEDMKNAKMRNEELKETLKNKVKTLHENIPTYEENLKNLKFKRQRWGLFIENHREQLEHALKMASFFAETHLGKQEEHAGEQEEHVGRQQKDAIYTKLADIAKDCEKFKQYYEEKKGELEKELNGCFEQGMDESNQ